MVVLMSVCPRICFIKKNNKQSEKEIRKLRATNNNRSNIIDILEKSKDKTILKDHLAAFLIDHLELTLDIVNLNKTRSYYSSILQGLIDEGIILEKEDDDEKKAKLRLAK